MSPSSQTFVAWGALLMTLCTLLVTLGCVALDVVLLIMPNRRRERIAAQLWRNIIWYWRCLQTLFQFRENAVAPDGEARVILPILELMQARIDELDHTVLQHMLRTAQRQNQEQQIDPPPQYRPRTANAGRGRGRGLRTGPLPRVVIVPDDSSDDDMPPLVVERHQSPIVEEPRVIPPPQSVINVPEPNQEINPMTRENSPALEEGEIAEDLQYPPEIGVLPFTCVSSGDENLNGNRSAGNA